MPLIKAASSMFSLFRGSEWWVYKTPPLLAIAYIEIISQYLPFQQSLGTLLAILVSIFSIGAYGYIINDICDIEVDRRAGKLNRMASLSKKQRLFLILSFALAGLIPWLIIGLTLPLTIALFALYLLLIIYPAPPLRLKERHLWGVLADAATAHAIPTFFITTAFYNLNETSPSGGNFLGLIATVWASVVGIRGILIHQLWDRNNDLKSGIKTFATQLKVKSIRLWINYALFPLETLLFGGIIVVTLEFSIHIFTTIAVYCGVTLVRIEMGKLDPSPPKKSEVALYDFYEVWLPLSLLTLLCWQRPEFLVVQALHMILFCSVIKNRLGNAIRLFLL